MTRFHPKNERIKRRYFVYLKDAMGLNEQSIDSVAKALHRFESHTSFKDFAVFHFEQARAFKRHIMEQRAQRTGEPLSKATLYSTLTALRKFFHWLAGQPGYRAKLTYADAAYFNLPEKDVRVAKTNREPERPTPEQILHVIRAMPFGTEIEQRDRAIVAFIFLTGARDRAVASLKLKHIDIATGKIEQDAREVNTKFGKTFTTFFFPVGEDVRLIVADWVAYLLTTKLWGLDDPLFPASKVEVGPNRQFHVAGLHRMHWSTAAPIRKIFKDAFSRAKLPYFKPHSFRSTLATLAGQVCRTPEEYKAWSQNLGHEQVLTTFRSYGQVPVERQSAVLRNLSARKPDFDRSKLIKIGEELIRAGEASMSEPT